MGKSVADITQYAGVIAKLSERLDDELGSADPQLITLLRMLIEENAEIRKGISDLREELRNANALADQDPLCPVLNRRAFMRELEREIARTERHGRDLSVLYIDLDKFKNINDQQGHDAGDRVLIAMAETLLSAVRKTDVVARLGGDEFGVILIEANANAAQLCVKALQSPLAARKLGIATSIGIAGWQSGQTAEDLISQADKAMFAHKNAK